MKIVSDIGGTYVRFAQVINGEPANIQKYAATEYKNLNAALTQYSTDQNITKRGDLLIAAAGANLNGTWTITNNPDWSIEVNGWNTALILNDFEAGTYSLPILKPIDLKTLKQGDPANNTLCIIGAGTGLGLGYYHEGRMGKHVQKTHGGHFPIASLNDEHGKTIKDIRSTLDRSLVFEDIISGAGLQKLRDLYDTEKASRLFHEFLGIFAATALVTGNAYGGLYLSGGIITSLVENDEFDFGRFNAALCFDAVPCVRQDIDHTPIHVITDPFPALKGLINAQSLSDN